MMTLKISKKYLANKTAKGFNEDVKSLMNINNTETRRGIRGFYIITKKTQKYYMIYRRDTRLAYD